MKPTSIKVSAEFPGLWLAAECPVAPDENPIEEIKKCRAMLINAYNEISGGNYSELPGHPMSVQQVERGGVKMEDAINSCTDMTILGTYKLLVKGKPDLQEVYDKKVIELSK